MKTIQDKPSSHDPGTPDKDVPAMRLCGRRAWRVKDEPLDTIIEYGCPKPGAAGRIEWWLGWYDERLRRFFGR